MIITVYWVLNLGRFLKLKEYFRFLVFTFVICVLCIHVLALKYKNNYIRKVLVIFTNRPGVGCIKITSSSYKIKFFVVIVY